MSAILWGGLVAIKLHVIVIKYARMVVVDSSGNNNIKMNDWLSVRFLRHKIF